MDSKETGKLLEDIGRFAELMGICRTVFENRTGAKSAGSSQSPTPCYNFQTGLSPLTLTFLCSKCKTVGERSSLPSLVTCLSVGYSVKRKIIFHEKSLFQGLRALVLGVQISNICIL